MTTHTDGLAQRRLLSDEERADVLELAAACNAAEGLELKVSVGVPPDDTEPAGNDFLYYAGGALVGYCALDVGRGVELCGMVSPQRRRRGIGWLLLAAAADECRRRGVARLLLICEREARAGQAFIATAGAQYRSGELRMHLNLVPFRARTPAGARLTLSKVESSDVEPLVHVLSGAFDDPEDAVRARIARDLPDPHGWFVLARLAGEPVGTLRVVDVGRAANIYAFGVLPAYRGRGLGRQILEATLEGLREEGYSSAALEVETENATAVALYRSCGFEDTTTYEYYGLELS